MYLAALLVKENKERNKKAKGNTCKKKKSHKKGKEVKKEPHLIKKEEEKEGEKNLEVLASYLVLVLRYCCLLD